MKARNVLLIHTDQQRWDSLGCMGNPCVRTPNIDRLASESSVFTRHVVSNAVCMPSRATLMTGLYPPAHNAWNNGVPLNRRVYADTSEPPGSHVPPPLTPEPPTMADVFAAAGYDTVSFGKLHLTPFLAPASRAYPESSACWAEGSLDDWHGPYYGFRYVDLLPGHGEGLCRLGHYGVWLEREHPEVRERVLAHRSERPRPVPPVGDLYESLLPSELHHSAWLGERFCRYLERERPTDRPFFAFVGFPDPHHPFTPSADVLEQFRDCPVHEPTDLEGRCLRGSPAEAKLRGEGISTPMEQVPEEQRNTIIRHTYAMVYQIDMAVGRMLDALQRAGLREKTIVIFTSDHGEFLCDHGLLRKALFAFDTLLRVPFVIRAPGAGLPARVDAPMSNADVLPTLAALTGIQPPAYQQGRDIRRILREGESHHALSFIADGDPAHLNYTVYDDRYRLTCYPNADWVEMFDHREDPAETANVAGERAADRRRLLGVLRETMPACWNPILARCAAW